MGFEICQGALQGQALGTGCVVGRLLGTGCVVGRLLGTGCVVGTNSWARAWGWLARDRACARRKAQEGSGFRAAREGLGVFAFNARSGPTPLALLGCVGDICVWGQAAGVGDRLLGTGSDGGTDSWARAWGWLARDRACARRKAQEGVSFRAAREGLGVFAFNARSGPIPLTL